MGFGSDEDDNTLFDDDQAPADTEPELTPAPTQPTPPDTEPAAVETIAADIKAGVVEMFNSFQPEFIARCLDPMRQQKLLAEQMAPALKERIASLIDTERQRAAQETANERRDLDNDLRRLRERNADLEKRRDELKEDKLSSSRQQRAFKERIHDLESKNEQLAAEKEQLELEVRSMSNRLRAAEVSASAGKQPAEPAPDNTRLNELIEKHREETAALTERLAEAKEKVKEAEERLKAAELHAADAATKAAQAEAKAVEAEARAAQAEQAAKDGNASDSEEMARLTAEVAESRSTIQRLSDSIVRKDSRLSEMKAKLGKIDDLNRKIEQLEADNRSLKSTIENNLFEHSIQMSQLRREMEESKPRRGRPRKKRSLPDDAEVEALTTKEKPSPETTKEKAADPAVLRITAIDEHIEGSEWLVAPTPEELQAPAVASEPSDDFGYHAPSRSASRADDPNQLTLF